MKIARFIINGENDERYGCIEDNTIKLIDGDIFGEFSISGKCVNIDDVKLVAPCRPTKIVAVGLNYADHANEMGDEIPEFPALFLKPDTAVIGPLDNIIYPPMSNRVDYEAELAIVIKKTAENISKEEALDYVLGYTCLNDVTARDLQKKDPQWMRAKSFNTFAPIGPVIETELDPNNLDIKLYLNSELRQNSNTSNFIFKPDYLISEISKIMTLKPGDIITTGTPSGIGEMKDGDTVEIEIEGIGILKNTVKRY